MKITFNHIDVAFEDLPLRQQRTIDVIRNSLAEGDIWKVITEEKFTTLSDTGLISYSVNYNRKSLASKKNGWLFEESRHIIIGRNGGCKLLSHYPAAVSKYTLKDYKNVHGVWNVCHTHSNRLLSNQNRR